MSKKIKKDRLYRSFEFNRESVNEENRTIELSFSSEAPVERWFGLEILDHAAGSCRLGRINNGGPLLLDHETNQQIGVIEEAEIGADRKGRALVRFSKSTKAQEIFTDVVDGIRRSVSVGYMVHKFVLEKEEEGLSTYRATDWEPLEISLVSVPADVTVGVGRASKDLGEVEIEVKVINNRKQEGLKVDEELKKKVQTEAREAEQKRVSEILSLGEQHGCAELARKFVNEGKEVNEFKDAVLAQRYQAKPVNSGAAEIGLTDKEARKFSMIRAINALANPQDHKAREAAAFEFECSAAVAKVHRKQPQGFFIPREVATRDLTKGTGSAGGYTVATELLTSSFIELLRNKMLVRKMGATILGGLVGDIAIPGQSGGATAYWVGENSNPTESQQTFNQLGMTPKTVGAFTDISRKLLIQSSMDVEGFVRGDLATVLALAIDLAAINGSGTAGQPLGILNTTGIGDVPGGTNGLAPTWAHIVALETEVAQDNADLGSLGYLTNAKVRGKLKTTEKASSTGQFIWENSNEPGFGMLNGYRAGASNQVPSNLTKGSSSGVCSAIIFGNWADLIIAEWGTIDVLVDPYTGGAAGTVRVRILQDTDVALRHPESMAAMQDTLTA